MSLIIKNLVVSVESKVGGGSPIIKDLSLTMPMGTVVGLMGPNGSGKSTLAYTLAGHPRYQIESGSMSLNGMHLGSLAPDQRARAGLLLSFQHPPEIPGVSIRTFFHETYRALHGKEAWIVVERRMLNSLAAVGLAQSFVDRALNEGFSGGERKRLEAAQLLFLKPKYAILDELDAGLDLDALSWLRQVIQQCKAENPEFSALVISHAPAVIQALQPDAVYVMRSGTIVASGDSSLLSQLQERGYDGLSL
jgi:Fe-S cluster assembly ATP-binding protein